MLCRWGQDDLVQTCHEEIEHIHLLFEPWSRKLLHEALNIKRSDEDTRTAIIGADDGDRAVLVSLVVVSNCPKIK